MYLAKSTYKGLISPATNTILMSAVTTATTEAPAKRALSPTEQQIAKLKAESNAKIAELRATGIRKDLEKGIKSNSSMSDDELYTLAKPFTNMIERKRSQARVASGEEPKRRGKGKTSS